MIFSVSVAALDCAVVPLVPLSVIFDVSIASLDCALGPLVPLSVFLDVFYACGSKCYRMVLGGTRWCHAR